MWATWVRSCSSHLDVEADRPGGSACGGIWVNSGVSFIIDACGRICEEGLQLFVYLVLVFWKVIQLRDRVVGRLAA